MENKEKIVILHNSGFVKGFCSRFKKEGYKKEKGEKAQVRLKKRGIKYEKRAGEQRYDEECTSFLAEKLKNVTLF